jgi:hypothetical protein
MENNAHFINEIINTVKEKQNNHKNDENVKPWEKSFVKPKRKVYTNMDLDDINVKGTFEYLNFYSNNDKQNDSALTEETLSFYITENNTVYVVEYNRDIDDNGETYDDISVYKTCNYGPNYMDEETCCDCDENTELPETFLKDVLEAIK